MKKIIRFSKFNTGGLVLSVIVTVTLIVLTVLHGGFNLGIDFRSGQNIVISIPGASNAEQVSAVLSEEFPEVLITHVNNAANRTYSIKISSTQEEQQARYNQIQKTLTKEFTTVNVLSSSFIAGTLSNSLFKSAIVLTTLALLLILVYVGIRFKFRFALAAIAALLHDGLFILGVIGALQIEVTVSTIAAVLTIIGYSLNDTIVIFDRIRENMMLIKGAPLRTITDTSISGTLSRTIITSLTTLLAVLALYFFATGDVQLFALTLFIGLIEGMWSSVFIATPMLYVFGAKKLTEAESGLSVAPQNTSGVLLSRDESQRTVAAGQGQNTTLANGGNVNTSPNIPDIQSKAARLREEILLRKMRKKK